MLVVPALLLVIAVVQIVRVEQLDQSSWSGAGFGMFAQIDGETTRAVRGFVVDDDEPQRATLPNSLERSAFELLVVPVDARATGLAAQWAQEVDAPPGSTFVVEVWAIRFDGGRLAVGVEPMLRIEVPT